MSDPKIGSIAQWGKIGKKDTGTPVSENPDMLDNESTNIPNNETTSSSENQSTNSLDSQDTTALVDQDDSTQNEQATNGLKSQDTSTSVDQATETKQPKKNVRKKTIGSPGNETTNASVVQATTPSSTQLTNEQSVSTMAIPVTKDTSVAISQNTSDVVDQATKVQDDQATKVLENQNISSLVVKDTSVADTQAINGKVVQYVRKPKPDRDRQTYYVYPDFIDWVADQAGRQRQLSDVANEAIGLHQWVAQHEPELLERYRAEYKAQGRQ